MLPKDLTMEDMKGKKKEGDWTSLDVLLEVTSVAIEKYNDEQKALEKESQSEKSSKKSESTISKIVEDFSGVSEVLLREKALTKPRIADDDHGKKKKKLMDLGCDFFNWLKGIEIRSENNNDSVHRTNVKKREPVTVKNGMKFSDGVVRINGYKKKILREKALKKPTIYDIRKKEKELIGVGSEEKEEIDVEFDPELKNQIRKLVGHTLSEIKFLIEKQLCNSDVREDQGRLSMPVRKVRADFLSDDEMSQLEKHNGKRCGAVEATLIEPSLRWTEISLRRWDMQSSSSYVLVGGWSRVVRNNGLKKGDTVQLWSFRVDSTLYFVLLKKDADDDDTKDNASQEDGAGPSSSK